MSESDKYADQIKQALTAIKSLKSQLAVEQNKQHEAIAIVGMAMRLPGGVENAEQYWNLLWKNTDAMEDIPADRFDAKALYDEHGGKGKIILKQGGYLKNVDLFDASFFDITRVEAESLDPQQRLLLEVTQEALENAGIPSDNLIDSSTGVFVGVTNVDYQNKHFRSGDYKLVNPYAYTGSAVCAHAGRISYSYGFQGEAISVDTACSSSLVATHLAVQSLRNRNSNIAIVGAANLILSPELAITFTALNGLSPISKCQPFSDNADGFVRSEGCAVIVLKRLQDAQNDKDNILAVIKGTAVNQDGKSNGFTAPSVSAQIKLIQAALQNAQLKIDDISYIEAHGTGTKIGDPIEVEAIAQVLDAAEDKHKKIALGSVKSNIGHTESAAGLAGVLKTVLSMQHNVLPKNLHSEKLNSLVDWQYLALQVVQENTPWNTEIKNAGISSFGVTGTNAHVVLQNYTAPETDVSHLRNDVFLLPISAKNEQALVDSAKLFQAFLKDTNYRLEDICAMVALRRNHYKYRKLFVAKSKVDVLELLNDFIDAQVEEKIVFDKEDYYKTIFVFPGQGAQWLGMGRNLLQQEPVFKTALEAYAISLRPFVSWDLLDILNSNDLQQFNELDIVQPVLVGISIALAKLWESKGVMPDGVIGHSLGEVAAAHIAGAITLDEAAEIICKRSRLMKEMSGKGLMLATDLSYQEALDIEKENFGIINCAVVNSKNSSVLSGDKETIERLAKQLEEQGRFARIVNVDVASHSYQMDGIDEQLKNSLSGLQPKNSAVAFYSTARNKLMQGEALDAEYWKNNLRNTVRFYDAAKSVMKESNVVFIEMSPHPTLLHALNENSAENTSKSVVIGSLFKDKEESISFYSNVAKLYESNFPLDWKTIYPQLGKFVQLPNYAWQKERYWFEEKPEIHAAPLVENKQNQLPLFTTTWNRVEVSTSLLSNKSIVLIGADATLNSSIQQQLKSRNNEVSIFSEEEELPNTIDFIFDVSCLTNNDEFAVDVENVIRFQKLLNHLGTKKTNTKVCVLTTGLFGNFKHFNGNASLYSGIFKSLKNELPEIKSRIVDLPIDWSEDELSMAFDISATEDYFDLLSINQNKIYSPQLDAVNTSENEQLKIQPNETTLIIGGTSGLGLKTAEWLSANGATHIVLVSRSGEKEETKVAIANMLKNKTEIAVFKGDMSNNADLLRCIQTIENDMPKVTKVIHAAAVLQDRLFTDMTRQEMEKVLQSKIDIARNLNEVFTDNKTALYFFSSAASILGTLAQSVYSGCNLYLDNLAQYRTQLGLPTCTINWGNIAEIGLAAQDEKRGKRLEENGLGLIYLKEIETYLSIIFSTQNPQYIPLKIDFKKWEIQYPSVKQNHFYKAFVGQENKPATASEDDLLSQVNMDAAQKLLKSKVKIAVASITKIPIVKLKEDETFKSIGMDSLMALQLKNKIQSELKLNLNVSSVWSYPTIEKYAHFLSEEMELSKHYKSEESIINSTTKSVEEEVKDLSLDELMRQLNEKL